MRSLQALLALIMLCGACDRGPDRSPSEAPRLPLVGDPQTAPPSSPAAARLAAAKATVSAVRQAHDPSAIPPDFLPLWEQALSRGPMSTRSDHSIYVAARGDRAAAVAVPEKADAEFLIGVMWHAGRQAFNVNLSRARERGGPSAEEPEVVSTRYGDAARFPTPQHTYYVATVMTERTPRRGWTEARTFLIWREPRTTAEAR